MKTILFALCPVLLLAGCCCKNPGVRVTHTDVASGAVNPKAIYIRPFQIAGAPFDMCIQGGNTPIRKSLAPVEFANDLQEELSKIAPARVLQPDESAPLGWVVEGVFDSVETGYAPNCWSPFEKGPVFSKSCIKMHVQIRDVCQGGAIVYAFDVEAKTRPKSMGSITTPGMGYPLPFDFRNTAELIALTLTPDPFKYGYHNSPELRY